jgi:hypothetical protein
MGVRRACRNTQFIGKNPGTKTQIEHRFLFQNFESGNVLSDQKEGTPAG